jgi:hypothetical protein
MTKIEQTVVGLYSKGGDAMKKLRFITAIGVFSSLVVLAAGQPSHALILDAYDSGHYSSSGSMYSTSVGHDSADEEYIVSSSVFGTSPSSGSSQANRNFLVFSIPTLTDAIVEAELHLDLGQYTANATSLTYELFSVETGIDDLIAGGSGSMSFPDSVLGDYETMISIFTDLGTGGLYGSTSIANTDTGTLDIALNLTALNALNAAVGSDFAIGGSLFFTSIPQGGVFADTGSLSLRQLELTTAPVPEPMTILLMGTGLVGFAIPSFRKRFKK